MTRTLSWSDLKLSTGEKAALEPFAISDPEAVVALAQGSPELLERVLPVKTVERLKTAWPTASAFKTEFSLGVPLTEPSAKALRLDSGKAFESRRVTLLAELENATSPAAKRSAMSKLKRLYARKGRAPARSGLRATG